MHSGVDTSRARTTVGIIDDFAILLESLTLWLERNAPDLDVVVCASSFKELVTDESFPPDVVIIGEVRHEQTSLGARIKACVAAGSQVVVVADDLVVSHRLARESGAVEALPRKTPMVGIVEAVRRARTQTAGVTRPTRETVARPKLSPGEHRALAYYVQGYSTQQVATAMNVKYETAKTFLRRVRQKYAALDRPAGKRAELIVRATEDGIL